jgi:hypothetical protein
MPSTRCVAQSVPSPPARRNTPGKVFTQTATTTVDSAPGQLGRPPSPEGHHQLLRRPCPRPRAPLPPLTKNTLLANQIRGGRGQIRPYRARIRRRPSHLPSPARRHHAESPSLLKDIQAGGGKRKERAGHAANSPQPHLRTPPLLHRRAATIAAITAERRPAPGSRTARREASPPPS